MLSNLRAMGVFACVVERNSFSAAAQTLGITTSAVSQQIRQLEQDLNVTLLHRSTRKIRLTEAGETFFRSCQEMMAAAERGKIRISELQDNLVGELRIATTPEIGAMHIVPALSKWMKMHTSLQIFIDAAHRYVDLKDQHIDIAIRMSPKIEQREEFEVIPLAPVQQVLLASPTYLEQHAPIEHPQDLIQHKLLPVTLMTNYSQFSFCHVSTDELSTIEMSVDIRTNNVILVKSLCQQGHGIARILSLDAQQELATGALVEVLPQWKLPDFILYVVVLKREQQSAKVVRCIEVLKKFFA